MAAIPFEQLRARRARPLTAGEIAMVALLFGDAIDYRRVRVHARRYLPFQPKNCAMTPNGHLYFHASCFLDDYAQAPIHQRHWFMHEMVHVWQRHLGYALRLRGAVRIGLSYDYDLAAGKTLADFNMEAQGELLADYFALKHLQAPAAMRQQHNQHNRASLPQYEAVLAGFLANPASAAHLPRGYGRCLLALKRICS
ncbi:Rhs element Vgr protein [Massilia sp. PWRC2]|uniref:Rhs element Vgr protein n=1 Tax=Massilia sp. PWRC2 TaxID=2804626 RepID=UPI003CFB66B0